MKSEVEEICDFGDDRTLLRVATLPEFVVDYVEIAPGAICMPKEKIASDYFAIIIPLKEQLDKQIRGKIVDSSAVDGVSGKTPIWQLYGVPVIAASDQQVWDRSNLSIQ